MTYWIHYTDFMLLFAYIYIQINTFEGPHSVNMFFCEYVIKFLHIPHIMMFRDFSIVIQQIVVDSCNPIIFVENVGVEYP